MAHDTRVGGSAGLVLIGKILDNAGMKLRRLIDEVIRDSQFVANGPGITHRLRSTAFVFGPGNAILRPELQGDPDDLVALLQQKRSRSGGIYATAHTDHYACFGLSHCRTRKIAE